MLQIKKENNNIIGMTASDLLKYNIVYSAKKKQHQNWKKLVIKKVHVSQNTKNK